MVDFLQRDHGQYSRVGTFWGMAFFACAIVVLPGRQAFFIEPYVQASTIDQGLVILFQVAEAILGVGFFLFPHIKNTIPVVSASSFVQQSRFALNFQIFIKAVAG